MLSLLDSCAPIDRKTLVFLYDCQYLHLYCGLHVSLALDNTVLMIVKEGHIQLL